MSTEAKDQPGLSWAEICHDPRFQDLPYKIETNARGQIVMSPTDQYYGAFQAEIAGLLRDALEGCVVTESAIATTDGKNVAAVAWFSDARWDPVKDALDAPIAPVIAVDVYLPGHTDEERAHKRRFYFEAGAEEVWRCDEGGRLTVYDDGGEREAFRRVPSFPAQINI